MTEFEFRMPDGNQSRILVQKHGAAVDVYFYRGETEIGARMRMETARKVAEAILVECALIEMAQDKSA